MKRLKGESKSQIEVKKSKFIALLLPCNSLTEIKAIIKDLWTKYPDASHIVHAAVIGKNGSEFSYSDDKEPKNTAGRPIFEVLKGSGITNAILVVIRYFGGTLLGTGGLVKAYGDAAKEAVRNAETEDIVDYCRYRAEIAYESYNQVIRLLNELSWIKEDESFNEKISITFKIPLPQTKTLKERLLDITDGKGVLEELSIS